MFNFMFPMTIGMTVGEEVEQVNYFLSRVGLMTKCMTKSGKFIISIVKH